MGMCAIHYYCNSQYQPPSDTGWTPCLQVILSCLGLLTSICWVECLSPTVVSSWIGMYTYNVLTWISPQLAVIRVVVMVWGFVLGLLQVSAATSLKMIFVWLAALQDWCQLMVIAVSFTITILNLYTVVWWLAVHIHMRLRRLLILWHVHANIWSVKSILHS